ncbi:hypothetical protein COCCU_14335 (plasmid) [Corynebacterium occultum]|uniref:Uncharacterized protein n=1 Tax=Corynebacterium occultum TaxID=2675219 RepID=A0A6B8W9X0_9CORY|nr:hypothetical protein COCCU_14335 [Corynebacterium occultum]
MGSLFERFGPCDAVNSEVQFGSQHDGPGGWQVKDLGAVGPIFLQGEEQLLPPVTHAVDAA